MSKHPMRQLADLLSEAEQPNRIEPEGDGYRIVLNGKPFGNVVPRNDGWVVTNVPAHKRSTQGSRYPHPSPQRAFYAYFGNARTYNPWVIELAKQLPADSSKPPVDDPPFDLDAMMRQADAAHDEAHRLDGKLRDLFAKVSAGRK